MSKSVISAILAGRTALEGIRRGSGKPIFDEYFAVLRKYDAMAYETWKESKAPKASKPAWKRKGKEVAMEYSGRKPASDPSNLMRTMLRTCNFKDLPKSKGCGDW